MDVLITDPDLDFCRLLQDFISTKGYACGIAADGRAALTQVLNHAPMTLIAALEMPGWGALDLMRTLRARGRRPLLNVVTTRRVQALHTPAFEELGVQHVIVRPCDLDAAVQVVDLAPRVDRAIRRTNLLQLAELWRDGATGVLSVELCGWPVTGLIEDGGPVGPTWPVLEAALSGSPMSFVACPVEGQGQRTAMRQWLASLFHLEPILELELLGTQEISLSDLSLSGPSRLIEGRPTLRSR